MLTLNEFLVDQCETLKRECVDYEDALLYFDELVKDAEKKFPREKWIKQTASDVLKEAFGIPNDI